MKRIVMRKTYMPKLNPPPPIRIYEPPTLDAGIVATFSVLSDTPMMPYDLVDVPEEEEYLTVGELRQVIAALPDDAEVQIYDGEYDHYNAASAVEIIAGKLSLQ